MKQAISGAMADRKRTMKMGVKTGAKPADKSADDSADERATFRPNILSNHLPGERHLQGGASLNFPVARFLEMSSSILCSSLNISASWFPMSKPREEDCWMKKPRLDEGESLVGG
jgi:hypothetical protein